MGAENRRDGDGFAVPLQAGDEVLVRARVVACTREPTHDLPRRDTGIVVLEVLAYEAGMSFTRPRAIAVTRAGPGALTKLCVPPSEVVAITGRKPR